MSSPVEQLLEDATEHIDAKHVEKEMRKTAMQERIAHELPGFKADAGTNSTGRVQRPEREPDGERVAQGPLQQENDDINANESLCSGRNCSFSESSSRNASAINLWCTW